MADNLSRIIALLEEASVLADEAAMGERASTDTYSDLAQRIDYVLADAEHLRDGTDADEARVAA